MRKFNKDGKAYILKPEFSHPGTQVVVRLIDYKRWQIVLRVISTDLQDGERSRVKESAISTRTWKTKETAKEKAFFVARNRKWLSSAGITFE